MVLMLSQYYLAESGATIREVCEEQVRIMSLCLMTEGCERLLLHTCEDLIISDIISALYSAI
jgi:hypothetical protein